MGRLLDEDPTSVWVSAFTDSASLLLRAAGAFGGNKAEEGHEFFRMFKSTEGSNFGNGDHRGHMFEAFECHQSVNQGFALPLLKKLEHFFFELGDSFDMKVNGGEIVLENAIVGSTREGEMAQVIHVGLRPVGFTVVVEAQTTKQCEQPGFGSAEIIDCVSASTAQVADGLVRCIGDIDRDKVVGAEVFSELHGITLVGLDTVAGFYWDE